MLKWLAMTEKNNMLFKCLRPKILFQTPVQAIKKSLAIHFASHFLKQDLCVSIVCPVNRKITVYLKQLEQLSLGRPVVLSSERKHNSNKVSLSITNIERLTKKLSNANQIDVIIIDGADLLSKLDYQKISKIYPNVKILGLASTHIDRKGRSLKDTYDKLIISPSIAEMIKLRLLPSFQWYTGTTMCDRVKISNGDFDFSQISAENDLDKITASIVSSYFSYSVGLRCLIISHSIRWSKAFANTFGELGVRAMHLDETTPKSTVDLAIGNFKCGDIEIISVCQDYYQQLDISGVDVLIMAWPTRSSANYLQAAELVLQPSRSRQKSIVIDHTNNWQTHGLANADRTLLNSDDVMSSEYSPDLSEILAYQVRCNDFALEITHPSHSDIRSRIQFERREFEALADTGKAL